MRYRVKEEYLFYDMHRNKKACAIDLDVNKPVEVLGKYDDTEGGSHRIKYYDKKTGFKLGGYMDIDMLEEWK